jgi:hypothetical protein
VLATIITRLRRQNAGGVCDAEQRSPHPRQFGRSLRMVSGVRCARPESSYDHITTTEARLPSVNNNHHRWVATTTCRQCGTRLGSSDRWAERALSIVPTSRSGNPYRSGSMRPKEYECGRWRRSRPPAPSHPTSPLSFGCRILAPRSMLVWPVPRLTPYLLAPPPPHLGEPRICSHHARRRSRAPLRTGGLSSPARELRIHRGGSDSTRRQ